MIAEQPGHEGPTAWPPQISNYKTGFYGAGIGAGFPSQQTFNP